jgi:hypothetical protein
MKGQVSTSERKTSINLEDAFFEDEFFEYDATEDPEGEGGKVLMERKHTLCSLSN